MDEQVLNQPTAEQVSQPAPQAQAQPSPSNAATAAVQASQQPGMTPPPQQAPPPPPPKRSLLGDIVHAVGSILGGPSETSRVNPQTGAVEKVPLSRSGRIANTAGILLRGAAAGAAQHGPGSVGKAALAGVQEQQQTQQTQQENTLSESHNVQQQLAAQAQRVMMQTEQAKTAWEMQREKTAVDLATQDHLDNMKQIVASDPANKDWGHYATFQDFVDKHADLKENGVNLPKLIASGVVRFVPTTEGGKVTGGQVYEVHPHWGDQMNTDPITIKTPSGVDAKGQVTYKEQTIPAGSVTNNAAFGYTQQSAQQGMQAVQDKAKLEHEKAETEEAEAGTQLKLAQAKNLGNGKNEDGSWNPASLPVSLVEGNMDPSQLSKRSQDYNAKLTAANEYSLAKYGKPFDIAQAQTDYKYANSPQTQNTLKYLTSLTGPDGRSGNLGELVKTSNGITRTDFPALNDAEAWARLETGDPAIAAYKATITEVADQVAKVLQGGGTGSATSDAKLKQATELFDKRFTKDQIIAISNALHPLLENRRGALIGDNRYLVKQYGKPQPTAATVNEPHIVGPNNQVMVVRNGQWVPLEQANQPAK